MDEKKEKNTKKVGLKNKKEAAKVLSKKTSTKAKKTPTKSTTKKTTKKVVPKETEKKVETPKKVEQPKVKKTTKKEEPKKVVKKETKKTTKKTTKKEEKNKIVLPKEWQGINKKAKKEKEEPAQKEKFSGRLKHSIFEEVDEKTFLLKKQKEKESIKKTFLGILIIAAIIGITVFILLKYNEELKKQLITYDIYTIGTKVELQDQSIWYVVEDSGNREETVKLLKETILDINGDSKYTDVDKKKYNTLNESNYDINNETSVAHYLETEYKKELENSVGKISEISLLTSKEFVKIREKMGFGYEWTTGNWLASKNLGSWWIISSPKSDSVYSVTTTGSYKLNNANALNYVRPTIVIKKEYIKKIEEPITIEDEIKGAVYGGVYLFEEN